MTNKLRLQASQSAVAHHIIDGPFTFPYSVDANSAVANHPNEWSHEPWSHDAVVKAREAAGEELEPISAEEQAALDEHAKTVHEANERLKAFRARKAAEKAEADQAELDEQIIKSPAPRPAVTGKRPFGRKGEPTEAELKMMRDKAHEDNLAAASASGAKITG